MKLEWFARKYFVFKGACKFRVSRTIFLKAEKSLSEIFCITRNVTRFNNRDDLLHISFTFIISIFSEAYT